MRALSALLLLAALAVPLGDAGVGASPPAAPSACGPDESIRALPAVAKDGAPGSDHLSPFGAAAKAPAEGPSGGGDGARRHLGGPSRRPSAPPPLAPTPPEARGREPRASAVGPALRAFPGHPSTAPPRAA